MVKKKKEETNADNATYHAPTLYILVDKSGEAYHAIHFKLKEAFEERAILSEHFQYDVFEYEPVRKRQ